MSFNPSSQDLKTLKIKNTLTNNQSGFTPTYDDLNNLTKKNTASNNVHPVVKNLVDAYLKSQVQGVPFVNNLVGGAVSEAGNIGRNAANLIPGLGFLKTPSKELMQSAPKIFNSNPSSLTYQGGKFLTDFGLPGGDFGLGAKLAEKTAAPALKVGARLLGSGASGSALGALTANPGQELSSAIYGGVGGAGLHGLGEALIGGTNKYLRKLAKNAEENLAGAKSPQQVKQLNEQLGGLPANFGDVVGNKSLANKINFLNLATPFSKAKNYAPILVGAADKSANDLFNSFNSGLKPEEAIQSVQKSVANNANKLRTQDRKLYKDFTDAADKLGDDGVQYKNVSEIVPDLIKEINEPNVSADGKNKILKTMQGYLPKEELIKINGQPISNLPENIQSQIKSKINKNTTFPKSSFKVAKQNDSNLGEKIRNLQDEGHNNSARILQILQDANNKDMEESASRLGSNVMQKLNTAKEFHAKEMVPYLRPDNSDIDDIVKNKANFKSIPATLMNNQNSKVLADLSREDKNNLLYAHFLNHADTDASNNPKVTANSLYRAFDAIPDEARPRLFSPAQIESFNQLKAFNDITPEAKIMLNPPPTGVRAALAGAKGALAGGLSYGLHSLGLTMPHTIPALIGAQRLSNKFLKFAHSPEIREAYVKGGFKPLLNPLKKNLTKAGLLAGIKLANPSQN